mmetsp:Transcript_125245/g.187044  ORF Transcript_125245/g.187044 Transcript_125245/m.187044 type:complete len:179 (+) Transcript_125245:3-539(+)
MDNLTWKLQAANTVRSARNKFLNTTDDSSGEVPISAYVRLYFYVACAILAFLGFIAIFTSSFIQGIICIFIAALIAFVELTFLIPPVEKVLAFFLANYLWRVIAYVILSVPTFLSWTTFIGGILILAGCAGYGYCVFKKEKPELKSVPKQGGLDLEEQFESSAFENKGDGLLSDYQRV